METHPSFPNYSNCTLHTAACHAFYVFPLITAWPAVPRTHIQVLTLLKHGILTLKNRIQCHPLKKKKKSNDLCDICYLLQKRPSSAGCLFEYVGSVVLLPSSPGASVGVKQQIQTGLLLVLTCPPASSLTHSSLTTLILAPTGNGCSQSLTQNSKVVSL